MKKILNVLSIIVCIILTFILSIFILFYVATVSIKNTVDNNGISNVLKEIDIVENLKSTGSGVLWEDLSQIGENIGLSEHSFEDLLNSTALKEQLGVHIEGVIRFSLNGNKYEISKEDLQQFLTIAIDEYNKVSDKKITVKQKNEVFNSISNDMIKNLNEVFESIDIHAAFGEENTIYITLINNVLYGYYSLAILGGIIFVTILIALFRFSYYKWMPYVSCSLMISAILIFGITMILNIVPMSSVDFFIPIKSILIKNMLSATTSIFALAVILIVCYKYLKLFWIKYKSI